MLKQFRLCIPAALLAAAGAASAAGPQDPVAIVRALRAESNAAIAAHDASRLRPLFDDDYHGIQGTSGALDSGGDATARSYGEQEFKDPTFVAFERNADTIEIAGSGRRIGETGHWLGTWHKPDGTMRKTGKYLAVWTLSKGQWRVRSESFVTLACSGSASCEKEG